LLDCLVISGAVLAHEGSGCPCSITILYLNMDQSDDSSADIEVALLLLHGVVSTPKGRYNPLMSLSDLPCTDRLNGTDGKTHLELSIKFTIV